MGRGADAAVRPAQARRSQGAGRVRVEAVAGPMPRRHRPAAPDPIGNVEASVRLSMGRRHFCVVLQETMLFWLCKLAKTRQAKRFNGKSYHGRASLRRENDLAALADGRARYRAVVPGADDRLVSARGSARFRT